MLQPTRCVTTLFRHALLLALSLLSLQAFSASAFAALLPDPVHRWSFTGNTLDTGTVGGATGTLNNLATVSGGYLHLDGNNQYMNTTTLADSITTRTLVSWISLNNLTQRAGSGLTLENPTGSDTFDAIVYGEQTANQWMNGSNGFTRTSAVSGVNEFVSPGDIMIAITYASGPNTITIYRNGVQYGSSYVAGSLITYPSGIADVLIGLRHIDTAGSAGTPTGNDPYLAADINEARIYNSALSAADIQSLFQIGPDLTQFPIPEPSTFTLLGLGAIGLAIKARRRRAAAAA